MVTLAQIILVLRNAEVFQNYFSPKKNICEGKLTFFGEYSGIFKFSEWNLQIWLNIGSKFLCIGRNSKPYFSDQNLAKMSPKKEETNNEWSLSVTARPIFNAFFLACFVGAQASTHARSLAHELADKIEDNGCLD